MLNGEVVIFTDNRTINQIQNTAFALVLSTTLRRVVKHLVEVLPLFIFNVGVKPVVKVRSTCFSNIVWVPLARGGNLKIFYSFFRGEGLKFPFLDGEICKGVKDFA